MSDTSNTDSSVGGQELAECVDGLPNLSGEDALIAATIADAGTARCVAFPMLRIRSRGSRVRSRSRCTCTSR